MDALKQKTDKEYEQLINTFSKELQRARNSQNAERDKKVFFDRNARCYI